MGNDQGKKAAETLVIPFSKYVGTGNDFILIDNREKIFPAHNRLTIQRLCHRQCGIGADGIILLEKGKAADFAMRTLNADGSEAEMCGNGIRCLTRFLEGLGIRKPLYHIESGGKLISTRPKEEAISVDMGAPSDVQWNISIPLKTNSYVGHFLNTGVPHIVIFVEAVQALNINALGREIRSHSLFQPKGTNVNFASITGVNEITIRTYERGVERETLACGTGATATALAAATTKGLASPIRMKLRSGESLEIAFSSKGDTFEEVTMTGPATLVYEGSFIVD